MRLDDVLHTQSRRRAQVYGSSSIIMASVPRSAISGPKCGVWYCGFPCLCSETPTPRRISVKNTRLHTSNRAFCLLLYHRIKKKSRHGVDNSYTYAYVFYYHATDSLTDSRVGEPPSHRQRTRSKSPRSRPTTPLRPSSRSSLRDSVQRGRGAASSANALEGLQDGFAELSDAMADLEQNFMQLQLMHESLARFSESFAGFLYGMNMNAFCVDFPEVCDWAPVVRCVRTSF
jgi:hypothetical protein